MLYLSFKFVRKFKFCVSPLVKRYPGIYECISFSLFGKRVHTIFSPSRWNDKSVDLHEFPPMSEVILS